MCGIAGAFFFRDRTEEARVAEHACAVLAHRGPDDREICRLDFGTLVHRRLSILDTSSAGHQPMFSEDGRYLLVHNGEIYNYIEIREDLRALGRVFRTGTDTEVIIAARQEWGESCVERFNGIWAFAMVDRHERTVWLSRDRLGVKPLFYAATGGGHVFGSEIKAVTAALPSRSPSLGAVRDYIWDGLVDHSDQTFVEEVRMVPPGTSAVIGERGVRLQRYWALPDGSRDADPRPSAEDGWLVARLSDLVTDAVRLQLRSDVPLGTCLSGGLDSSIVVTLATRVLASTTPDHEAAPRLAVTAAFEGDPSDESAVAAETARLAGIRHVVARPEPGDLVENLASLVSEQDEPFVSASILAQRAVMEAAASAGIKVMLDGQGADELLAGYPDFRYAWLLGVIRSAPTHVAGALRALRAHGVSAPTALRKAALAGLDLESLRRLPLGRAGRPPAWLGPEGRRAAPLPLRRPPPMRGETPLSRSLRSALVTTSLPSLLRYEDRNSMRFGVEARVPFLDHRLVEAAVAMPDRLKIRDGVTKWGFREVGRGLVPERVRTDRRKLGFIVPQTSWLAAADVGVREVLGRSLAASDGVLSADGLALLLAAAPSASRSDALWRCLSVELWYRTVRDGAAA